ncbi:hypothetical protein DMENIID0001_004530 [Sergentomyia squamirostris]
MEEAVTKDCKQEVVPRINAEERVVVDLLPPPPPPPPPIPVPVQAPAPVVPVPNDDYRIQALKMYVDLALGLHRQ